jgi:N-methylhydantoinase B/oxoprolinase/acetone carboxylase alpha subunit
MISIKGYVVRPANTARLRAVLVIHENRGLTPTSRMLRGGWRRRSVARRRNRSRTGNSDRAGLLGGDPGAINEIAVSQDGTVTSPAHLSKGEDYVLTPGDWIAVKTPGGGGYGPAAERDPAMVQRDIARGYYTADEAVSLFTRPAAAE